MQISAIRYRAPPAGGVHIKHIRIAHVKDIISEFQFAKQISYLMGMETHHANQQNSLIFIIAAIVSGAIVPFQAGGR